MSTSNQPQSPDQDPGLQQPVGPPDLPNLELAAAQSQPSPPVGPFDPAGVVWMQVSFALARVRRAIAIGCLGPLVIAGVVLGVITGEWYWHAGAVGVFAIIIWAFWLIGRQVRAMGYAERDEDLLIRSGVMFRSMVVVPYGRMQYVDVSVGPIARYYKISSVQLHTASPSTGAVIHGLPQDEAARLRDRLAARGEARLAGL